MKAKTFNSVGALHPILFFAVMYVVVLFLSIFICSSLFNAFNSSEETVSQKLTEPVKQQSFPVQVSTAVVVR